MANPFHVSEAASLALHTMMILASHRRNTALTTRRIAARIGASQAHLAKVLQRLVRAGFVRSVRGPRGGFRLGKSPGEVSLLEIYELIEGPLSTATCYFGKPICGKKTCIFGGLLESIGVQLREHLANTKLSDLVEGESRQCARSERS